MNSKPKRKEEQQTVSYASVKEMSVRERERQERKTGETGKRDERERDRRETGKRDRKERQERETGERGMLKNTKAGWLVKGQEMSSLIQFKSLKLSFAHVAETSQTTISYTQLSVALRMCENTTGMQVTSCLVWIGESKSAPLRYNNMPTPHSTATAKMHILILKARRCSVWRCYEQNQRSQG